MTILARILWPFAWPFLTLERRLRARRLRPRDPQRLYEAEQLLRRWISMDEDQVLSSYQREVMAPEFHDTLMFLIEGSFPRRRRHSIPGRLR